MSGTENVVQTLPNSEWSTNYNKKFQNHSLLLLLLLLLLLPPPPLLPPLLHLHLFFFLLFYIFFFLDGITVQCGPSPNCSVARGGKWGNLTGVWYKYVVAYSQICLGGNEKKAREIFAGLCSGRDSNRAFASLEGLSETMKQVKYIQQDTNWVPPEYNLTFVPLH